MATMTKFLLILSLLTLSILTTPAFSTVDSDDEDLSFLESDDDDIPTPPSHLAYPPESSDDEHDHDDHNPVEDFGNYEDEQEGGFPTPEIDESDVVILKESNFTDFISQNKHTMVEFYAPWCGHCLSLAPEYATAATALKSVNISLAKVDATEETKLAEEYHVEGFPTIFFFVDGVHKPYTGQRTADAIVSWIKKKTGPGVQNVTSVDEAEKVVTGEEKVVFAFVKELYGGESEELAAAAKSEDDVNFYQSADPSVAKVFHIGADVKRPALVILKKEEEKVTHYDGEFVKSAIAEFVSANKLPLVTTFTRETAQIIFESPIKKQLLLFATGKDSEKVIPVFQEAAKLFKGKLVFVYVEMDNEEHGKPVSDYFGISGNAPQVIGYAGTDGKKFVLDGEVALDKLKVFGEDFLEDKLKPFYKSDPIPETNDGDVKIVVGNSFDEIVLDESKDVLLEVYAPWCGHCQALEPTLNKLAKHLRSIDSVVIAKMDGTTNEHPRAKVDGFPTLYFFPAGNKKIDPIVVDADRTVVAFYKFIKKHATTPFKLEKPASTPTTDGSADAKDSIKSESNDLKDEL